MAEIPADMVEEAKEKRMELVAALADVDEEMAEIFLNEEDPSNELLTVRSIYLSIRRYPANLKN